MLHVFTSYASTRILGFPSEEAQEVISDLATWIVHRADLAGIIAACGVHRREGVGLWHALLLQSAAELECDVLWTEGFNDGQQYGSLTVRNPFLI